MPAACGPYATFGWTALALAPHMVGFYMRSGSPGTAQGAVLNVIENIIAVIIVTLVARRASWPAHDYLGLSSRPRAGAVIIAVTGQFALGLVLAINMVERRLCRRGKNCDHRPDGSGGQHVLALGHCIGDRRADQRRNLVPQVHVSRPRAVGHGAGCCDADDLARLLIPASGGSFDLALSLRLFLRLLALAQRRNMGADHSSHFQQCRRTCIRHARHRGMRETGQS
jgi:hypothetical protein